MPELKNLEDFELNHSCTDAGPGFHGDLRFIELMDSLLKESDAFIETGTNMGNTLYFVSRNYNIPCYSCEIVSDRTPTHVLENHNITWKNTSSPSFLYDIVKEESDIVDKKCVFYLKNEDPPELGVVKTGPYLEIDPTDCDKTAPLES